MSLVEVHPMDPAQLAAVHRDADAIEHAMHEGRLYDLGLRTDTQVREQIAVSLAQARDLLGDGPDAIAGLAAADYCDHPAGFAGRRRSALWRACQLHGAEWLWWQLIGQDPTADPAPLIPAVDELAEALLAESAGPGVDGDR